MAATTTHTCSTCGTEYRSFATYTRQDACYAERQAKRFECDNPFTDEDIVVGLAPGAGRDGHSADALMAKADFEFRAATAHGGKATSNQFGTFANHTPSDKQVAFIKRLAAERNVDVDPLWVATKKGASRAIDLLMAMPKPQAAAATPAAAQERRANRYGAKCIRCGQWVEAEAGYLAKDANDKWAAEHKGTCPEPKSVAVAEKPDLVKGDVHVVDGEYYRVHMSQGTGNLYAARFTGTKFEYERGAIRLLTAENKATAEQAAAFGELYHRCCFCSLQLDTPESTKVGYGPKCAVKHDLPWG